MKAKRGFGTLPKGLPQQAKACEGTSDFAEQNTEKGTLFLCLLRNLSLLKTGKGQERIFAVTVLFYEDDINGTISHERFLKLSAEYEAEQKELTEKVNAEQKEVDTYEQNKSDFDSFAAIIRKYVGITELTPIIVNEFIKKIVIHAPEKRNGKRFQKVDIIFNFVGEICLPTEPQTDDTENNEQEKTA